MNQLPSFLPYLAAFSLSLFVCVLIHLFVRSRSLGGVKSSTLSKSEELGPFNCQALILQQITLVQTFPHPSPAGRQNAEKLSELLLASRLYHPTSKVQLDAFAGRLREVYDDEGLFLMALMDLRKWTQANLGKPELNGS